MTSPLLQTSDQPPPRVELKPATAADAEVLRRLAQLYVYDFSALLALELDDDGLFSQLSLAGLFDDPRRHAFLVLASGRLAGFVIVRRGSRLTLDPDVWDIEEFFIVRRHRRSGVGTAAAHLLFSSHRGRFEVRQRRENVAATAFWRRAIGSYAQSDMVEHTLDDERWRGVVQRFTS